MKEKLRLIESIRKPGERKETRRSALTGSSVTSLIQEICWLRRFAPRETPAALLFILKKRDDYDISSK